jgi:hypothetical protein
MLDTGYLLQVAVVNALEIFEFLNGAESQFIQCVLIPTEEGFSFF